MNVRVLRIEMRRSLAPWSGAVVLTSALAFLYLLDAQWWRGTTAWTAQWTSLALWTRGLLFYLWPLAVGLGALQGLRDRRSGMSELLTSTPRPAWHRAATVAGTTAIALTAAYAALVATGGVQVFAHTGYWHLGWLPISLVGALFLVAGAVLGLGVGRALPSPLTPPALTMGAFVFTALMQMSPGRTESTSAAGVTSTEPKQVSLLSPAVQEVRDVFVTLSAAVHVGQTVWLLGLAATGFALLVATTGRGRLIAPAPAVAGLALALLVLPTDPRRMYVVDGAAAEQVCDGQVCVSATQRDRLADLAGPGRRALRLLDGALGAGAPRSVREDTAVLPEGATPRWSPETVRVDFDDPVVAEARGAQLTRSLVAVAMVPGCSPVGWSGTTGDLAARTVAAGWVLGSLEPLPGTTGMLRADTEELARPVWQKLRALPRAEQFERIVAARAAATSCEGDAWGVLSGGASR